MSQKLVLLILLHLSMSIISGYNEKKSSLLSFQNGDNFRRRLYYGINSYFGDNYDKDDEDEKGGYYPSIWKKYRNKKSSSSSSKSSKSSKSSSKSSKSSKSSESSKSSSKSKSSESKSSSKSQSDKSGSSKSESKSSSNYDAKIVNMREDQDSIDSNDDDDYDDDGNKIKYKMREIMFKSKSSDKDDAKSINSAQIIDHHLSSSISSKEAASSIFYAKWSFYILLVILVTNIMAILYCLLYQNKKQEIIGKSLSDDETERESSSC